MMPRSTSVVPPWIVSFGAIVVANASCSSNAMRLAVSSGSTNAAISRTLWQLLLPERAEILDH